MANTRAWEGFFTILMWSGDGLPRHAGRGLAQSLLGSSFGSSTGAANSLITLALLSGDTQTAQRLIKQQLQMGDIADVSSALADAASNVGFFPSDSCVHPQHSLLACSKDCVSAQ